MGDFCPVFLSMVRSEGQVIPTISCCQYRAAVDRRAGGDICGAVHSGLATPFRESEFSFEHSNRLRVDILCGQFEISRLWLGKFTVTAKKEDEGYPDTNSSVYSVDKIAPINFVAFPSICDGDYSSGAKSRDFGGHGSGFS